jgi:small subunit ribosomal protein S8
MVITLRYGPTGERVISGIQRKSRSGRRVYVKKNEIPTVLGGLGISIVSTPQGLMTGTESRRRGLGGEVICTVW